MEISQMTKIIGAAVAIAVTVVAIVVWSKFAAVKPEAAAATNAAAAEDRPIISPFDIPKKHGKKLPPENRRPGNLRFVTKVPWEVRGTLQRLSSQNIGHLPSYSTLY